MSDKKEQQPQPVSEQFISKKLVWCSSPGWEQKEVISYYADTLHLVHIDDGSFCLELKAGGTVARLPLGNMDKYLI